MKISRLKKRLRRHGMVLVSKARADRMSSREWQAWDAQRRDLNHQGETRRLAERVREAKAEAEVWKGIAQVAELKAAEARIELAERHS